MASYVTCTLDMYEVPPMQSQIPKWHKKYKIIEFFNRWEQRQKNLVYNMNLIVEIRKHASSVTLVKFQGHKIIFKVSDFLLL